MAIMQFIKTRMILLAVCWLFTLLTAGNSAAVETRGLRIIAKDGASRQQKEMKIYNKSYAVIIGIDQYPNLAFDQQLSYAVRDAKGVEQVLRKNFKFDKIITLYNKEASKDNIMKVLLGDLSTELTEEDAVFIFWAGHGYTEKTAYGDLGYLIPFDGTFNPAELYKDISMTMVRYDISKKIPAKHVFYVMDACYSGLVLATRGGEDRKSARDYSYLQEITKEKVRQVLTAGDKGQEVLDGGSRGHSVFTGRFIEILENSTDFITATEISHMLKEKVFSDAKARNFTQTPKYGELFGVGDFVFVPSLEQKVEDTQGKVADLQKELEQLKATEEAAAQAQDDRARRQAELEKNAVEAKLKAEQLRNQALEEQKQRSELEDRKRVERESELVQKKSEEETRLAVLKGEVAEKRKNLGDTTMNSLSPETTIKEMQALDAKILEIKESFKKELTSGILSIAQRINGKFKELGNVKKSEFETVDEFNAKVARESQVVGKQQTEELKDHEVRIEAAYKEQITPFIKTMKELSANEFILTADQLLLELNQYDATTNSYPVKISAKKPIQGIQVAANANIPLPRMEAQEFRQHFDNGILRPEIRGNFQSSKMFRVAQAYVIDDATNKKYDLFSARYIDLNNGIIYDSRTKLMWMKNTSEKELSWENAMTMCERLEQAGLRGWRLPTKDELIGTC